MISYFIWTGNNFINDVDVVDSNNLNDPNSSTDQKIDEILKLVRQIAASGYETSRARDNVFESGMFPISNIDAFFAFEKKLSDDVNFKHEVVSK